MGEGGQEGALSAQLTVFVREFRFEGNTVFTASELLEVVKGYLNREVTSEDLEEARRALTMHYINLGFINSGAILPDQPLKDGVITFRIVEGKLSDIVIKGNRWLRSQYIEKRLERAARPPLNLLRLKDSLDILHQDQKIKRLNAELKPGVRPGEGYLDVEVEEEIPIELALEFSNKRPPSIGAERFALLAADRNLTGYGDVLEIDYGITKNGLEDIELAGVDDYSVAYTFPPSVYDTTLQVSYSRHDVAVIEEPFDDLDITGDFRAGGITLRQPVYRTPDTEIAVYIAGERRQGKTFLDGDPFSFTPGADDGQEDVTAIRIGQELLARRVDRALAARSIFSAGIDALGATTNRSDIPDGRFFAWLGQLQYLERLFGTDNQLIARIAGQVTDDPLLAIEQLGIGGLYTVRGYREYRLLRDRGVIGSIEVRVPVWRDGMRRSMLDLAPFFDIGYGRNSEGPTGENYISSAGIGALFHPNKHVDVQVYYGYPFRKFDNAEDDIQDLGIHFVARISAF